MCFLDGTLLNEKIHTPLCGVYAVKNIRIENPPFE
jgi:hypothetical protein